MPSILADQKIHELEHQLAEHVEQLKEQVGSKEELSGHLSISGKLLFDIILNTFNFVNSG